LLDRRVAQHGKQIHVVLSEAVDSVAAAPGSVAEPKAAVVGIMGRWSVDPAACASVDRSASCKLFPPGRPLGGGNFLWRPVSPTDDERLFHSNFPLSAALFWFAKATTPAADPG
jgi:hypothetical protein